MFEDKKIESIRGITTLYPETIQIVVRAESGIGKLEDLAGEKVVIELALVILGAVVITSTIWSSIIDVLKELWASTASYYKFATGLLLLAIGLIVIILSLSKKSDGTQHDMRC